MRDDLQPPVDAVVDLAAIMNLEPLGDDRFRAHRHKGNHVGAVFGGALLAQALRAAELTAPERAPHAMHALFHRAGNAAAPIDHQVDRVRDGGASTTRRVGAWQGGELLFEALVMLRAPAARPGYSHQQAWRRPPPPPDRTPMLAELAERWADRLSASELATLGRLGSGFDLRLVDADAFMARAATPFGAFWVRPRPAPTGPAGYGALVFTSDFMMARAATLPHLRSAWDPRGWTISLDHAIWLHAAAAPDAWLLYEIESPWAGDGRGVNLGRLYDEDGRLLATVAQEALIRTSGGSGREG